MTTSIRGKKIILGISGSIAAYKAAFLTRILIKEGCEVKVIMTPASRAFISPLTLSTLSKNPVHTDVIDEDSWDNHVELGLWADVFIIAPATATTMAKMVTGIADNMVIATYLSAKCPVFFAPAMDLDMWAHPSTLHNVNTLLSYNNHLIPVEHGELASGLVGDGRMAEPIHIVRHLKNFFEITEDLLDKNILITAGPTYESIDPVRYIGNHSTGKMGIALAEECAGRGGNVTLVLGPTKVFPINPKINVLKVTSAQEMFDACMSIYDNQDISIFTAAVADYTPANPADQKIKKKESEIDFNLKLVQTKDIAFEMGKIKKNTQINIGFALETNNEEENAIRKLKKKNFDFIVLNSMADEGAGFKHNTNKITIYHQNGEKTAFSLKDKNEVAVDIVNELIKMNTKS